MGGLSRILDRLSDGIGHWVAWLTLFMVVLQFSLVVARYLFGMSEIKLDETLLYAHGCLFLFATGFTLRHNGHVRVDLFYREASARAKAVVNLVGTVCLLMPLCALTFWAGLPFVEAAWQSMEGSQETSGLPFLYLYKSTILVFAVILSLQAVSEALKAMLALSGQHIMAEDEKIVL